MTTAPMNDDTLLTIVSDPVAEEGTPVLTLTIVDQDGVGFKPTTLTRTLYDRFSGEVIEAAVSKIDECDADGLVLSPVAASLTTLPATMPEYARTRTCRALFLWTWDGGTRSWHHEIEYVIKDNLAIANG